MGLIDNLLDDHIGITTTDTDGTIEYVSNKFCHICKYPADELVGRNIRMINSDDHSEESAREMWRTIAQGEIWKGEIRNRAKDGSLFWTSTTVIPILNSTGTPEHYTAIHTEITECKETKQRMEAKIAELTRSNDELEQFAYVVTHDLQEPLRAINSFTQLLKRHCDNQLDKRTDELIALVIDGATRMQMLINDLLTYAQTNPDQAFSDVDCAQQLNYVLTDLSIAIDESHALISYDKLPVVKGIPFQFTQLFHNLISNAIKFRGQQQPRIHIGIKEESNEWIFCVSDNGIGMEERYLERIFQVFQRLHSRREYAGTGIGLAICKKIIDHHKGKIWVKSTPNIGSEFYFAIPKS